MPWPRAGAGSAGGAHPQRLPGALLQVDVAATVERGLAGRQRFACLPAPWRLEDFDFSAQPKLDRTLIEDLTTLRFVEEAANVLFIRPPGVGKTMLSVVLARRAVEAGYRVYYTTAQGLAASCRRAAIEALGLGGLSPARAHHRARGGATSHAAFFPCLHGLHSRTRSPGWGLPPHIGPARPDRGPGTIDRAAQPDRSCMYMSDQDVPKYWAVTRTLEHEIRAGRLAPGHRIPGEHELAQRFDVSRGTVRQALAILARRRLIRTHPGAGSYVEFGHERLEYTLGWSAALARHGTPTSSRVLRLQVLELPDLATRVGSSSALFVALDRVRLLVSGEPVSLERSRLPLTDDTRRLLSLDFSRESLTSALRRAGLLPSASEEWVHVHRLLPEEADLLGRAAGDPYLLIRRVTRGKDGATIEHVESLLDPERFHLHFGPAPLGQDSSASPSSNQNAEGH